MLVHGEKKLYDVVVLGLGGVGSFTLRSLGKHVSNKIGSKNQALKVLGIERYELGHNLGSSHGKTRIYRKAYFEDPQYVPWIDYSINEFEKLEIEQNIKLKQPSGCLLIENSNDENKLPPMLTTSMESATTHHNIDVEFLNSTALQQRFPQFNYSASKKYNTNFVGLLESSKTAGIIRCEDTTNAAIKQAQSDFEDNQKNGSELTILENSAVKSIREVSSSSASLSSLSSIKKKQTSATKNDQQPYVELIVQNPDDPNKEEQIFSKIVLVSAGSWTSQLIPSWASQLNVTRQLQCWIDVGALPQSNKQLYDAFHLPPWVIRTPEYHLPLYGLPCDINRDDYSRSYSSLEINSSPNNANNNTDQRYWFKVGIHGREEIIDDPTKNPKTVSDDEMYDLQIAVSKALKNPHRDSGISSDNNNTNLPQFAHVEPCMYTMTPDEQYMIGVPKGYQSICCVGGLSGHGFKMTPALGQMLADFAIHNVTNDTTTTTTTTITKPNQFLHDKWNTQFCDPSRFGV